MKRLMGMVGLMLLSAAVVTPAEANWFSNQKSNTMFNVGSIANPTPQQLRAFYAKRQARTERRN